MPAAILLKNTGMHLLSGRSCHSALTDVLYHYNPPWLENLNSEKSAFQSTDASGTFLLPITGIGVLLHLPKNISSAMAIAIPSILYFSCVSRKFRMVEAIRLRDMNTERQDQVKEIMIRIAQILEQVAGVDG